MNISSYIKKIVKDKLTDQPPGIFSVCSANPFVLKAAMKLAKSNGFPLLIESTCNQVNQFGGYMNLKPADFVRHINNLCVEIGLPSESVFLGGDHLGPSVWKSEPAASAMEKSIELVQQYIRTGYKKIHLDASMPCHGDEIPLPREIIAEREAQLCAAAVKESSIIRQHLSDLIFVVGTEVPTPGGSLQNQESIEVSSIQETKENIQHTREAFIKNNLENAWEQTCAFVVQPGVEFSDTHIHKYERDKAAELSNLIEEYDHLIFEAHSTDYQSGSHLKQMVSDHFAILKVGPALTFAMREAIFALEDIERELLGNGSNQPSNLKTVLETVMVENPKYWEKYYSVDPKVSSYQRKYSFLDRCRYYWSYPDVEKSLSRLIKNLSDNPIPLSLINQFLPNQFSKLKEGSIKNHPQDLILGRITDVLGVYMFACGFQQ